MSVRRRCRVEVLRAAEFELRDEGGDAVVEVTKLLGELEVKENVCAALAAPEVKVTPTGPSSPAPFASTASCAWHAIGNWFSVGASFCRTYPYRPVVSTWNWLPRPNLSAMAITI